MPLGKRARYAGALARFRYAGRKALPPPPAKRGRTMVRRMRGRRAQLLRYNLHAYKRWANVVLYSGTSSIQSQSHVFKFSDTVNASELTALYDQFMITGVACKISMVTNPDASYIPNTTATLNTNNHYPKLWYSRDYDNSAVETVDELKQRNTTKCKILMPNRFVTIFIKPAVLNQLFLDGVSPATSPIWNQWLDCSNTQVPHYGLKLAFDTNGYTSTNNWQFRMEICYYVKFKNCR